MVTITAPRRPQVAYIIVADILRLGLLSQCTSSVAVPLLRARRLRRIRSSDAQANQI